MRRHILTMLSILAASTLAFFTISTFTLPKTPFWFFGHLSLSAALGIVTVLPSYLNQKSAERSSQYAEQLYANLEDRLKPLLLEGLEGMLERIAKIIAEGLAEQLNGKPLKFYIFMRIQDRHRIIAAANVDKLDLVRRISLTHNEGIVGFTVDKAIPVIAAGPEKQKVFELRDNKYIGMQNLLEESNLSKCDPNVKWIYARPIFVTSSTKPWDATVIGVLTVDSLNEDGDKIFRRESFSELVGAIASAASPYLEIMKKIPEI